MRPLDLRERHPMRLPSFFEDHGAVLDAAQPARKRRLPLDRLASSRSSPAGRRTADSPPRAAAADPAPATTPPGCMSPRDPPARTRPPRRAGRSDPGSPAGSPRCRRCPRDRFRPARRSGRSITTRSTIPMGSRRSCTSKIFEPVAARATRSAGAAHRARRTSAREEAVPLSVIRPLKNKKWAPAH